MVLAVRKHLEIAKIIIPNNPRYCNFPKKSIPGDARAQVLQDPVGASHADQGRKSGVPTIFLGPGGQEESNGTPHLTLQPPGTVSQGGELFKYIYRYNFFEIYYKSDPVFK